MLLNTCLIFKHVDLALMQNDVTCTCLMSSFVPVWRQWQFATCDLYQQTVRPYVHNAVTVMNDKTATFLKEKPVRYLQIYYCIGDYSHKYLQGFAAKMNYHRPCITILYSLQKPADCIDENTTGCVLTLSIKAVRTKFCWLTWFSWLLMHPVSPKRTLTALQTLCFNPYS